MPAQSRRGTDRFQGRFVGLVAPEDGLCAEFCLSLLDYGLAPSLSKRLKPVYDIHDGQAFLVDVMDEDAPDLVDAVELGLAIRDAVARMTRWQRTVLVLHMQGYHFTEIARYFKRTEGSPRAAYGRALLHLRRCLEEHELDGNP